MTCVGCQQRREMIAKMAREVGTIVFGGRKRVLGSFSEDDRTKGHPAGLVATADSTSAVVAATVGAGATGAAGESGASGTDGGAGI